MVQVQVVDDAFNDVVTHGLCSIGVFPIYMHFRRLGIHDHGSGIALTCSWRKPMALCSFRYQGLRGLLYARERAHVIAKWSRRLAAARRSVRLTRRERSTGFASSVRTSAEHHRQTGIKRGLGGRRTAHHHRRTQKQFLRRQPSDFGISLPIDPYIPFNHATLRKEGLLSWAQRL
jgi:hypothetical protein